MTKDELLNDLRNETYVTLQPSPIHGIGVFAIRDIPKGCRNMFSKGVGKWLSINRHDIDSLPSHTKKLVETYCLHDCESYYIPDYGFKVVDLVIYLNHSDTPNIVSLNDGEEFEAIADIREGEELFIDYNEII